MRVDPNYVPHLSSAISLSSTVEANLTQELSSGLRITQLGDDTIAAGQALSLGTDISRGDTFVQTASREASLVQATDATIAEVVSQLTSAVSLATQGTTGTLNASQRSAIVNQLQGIQSQILALANTVYQGQYLFSGSKSSTKPYTLDSTGAATYAGDTVQQTITTPNGQSLITNLAGSSVFQGASGDVFNALNTVITDLSTDPIAATSAADSTLLTTALATVSQQRSILDSSLSRLTATSSYVRTQNANYTAAQSTLIAADPTVVVTQLKSAETQHQSLLDLVAALSKDGSLFDYLK